MGLIQHQKLWCAQLGRGNGCALEFPRGEALQLPFAAMDLVKSRLGQQIFGLLGIPVALEPLEGQEILQCRHVWGKALTGQQKACIAAGRPEPLGTAFSKQRDSPMILCYEPRQDPQQGGFARTVVAHQAVDLARFQSEGHLIQSLETAVALGEILNGQYVHGAPPFRRDPGGEWK